MIAQSIDLRVPVPPSIVAAAGGRRLVYELHVTNFRPVEVVLTRLEIWNGERTARIADLSGQALVDRIMRPGMRPERADRQVIGGGMHAVVYLWLALEDSIATPTALRHRIGLSELQPPAEPRPVEVESGVVPVGDVPPVVLDAPLRGGPWVAIYDPAMRGGHRTSIYTIDGHARIPGRFAIDWIKLGQDGTLARGDAAPVRNWHGYSADVLAVADGIVTAARDDMPEDSTVAVAASRRFTPEAASGNYVSLDIGGGRFVFYEHLAPGSLTVRAGDRVTRGDVIGRLGNSGSSSSGPHLHFHVSDADATLAAEGVPFVFRGFEVLGAYDSIGAALAGSRWNEARGTGNGRRTLEMPGPNTVITFDSGTTP